MWRVLHQIFLQRQISKIVLVVQICMNTAKTFYAASIFFEILYQFGELQPEIEQKQKYAVWKATDIRKALKEVRKPEPGPPGGDPDQSISSGLSSYTYVCSITCIS
ncbi:hypothetical protein ZIOFF_050759 [Zingiber officinale]|uniref:Vta1/callose synthase N-terminal domain-containing protein n=1 Tax=Zingiber officinale TaxID=94328 RepID=A0A8J5FLM9_ZINOF|nr:hypothetical protein ZIOFF_050759 [Zingiber officinale]